MAHRVAVGHDPVGLHRVVARHDPVTGIAAGGSTLALRVRGRRRQLRAAAAVCGENS
ncbi:hypothetical protein [Streptomyces sp. rh34]|uniref:hypothetical protein n=1 Tax=Streptomyces sp. rh34 TaxID=2034272 RepID=UPI0015CF4E7C|nr:hypothetical protein [Streptomyces sp. rh34]